MVGLGQGVVDCYHVICGGRTFDYVILLLGVGG